MWFGALIPRDRNTDSLGPSKAAEKEPVLVTVINSRAMGTDRHLVATARYRIDVAQYNANVTLGPFVCHRCEFDVEHLFFEFTPSHFSS